MKMIVAGSRTIGYHIVNNNTKDHVEEISKVFALLNGSYNKCIINEVVSGTALGADELGEMWAIDHDIPIKRFKPDWKQHGKAAGPIRNKQMAEYADAAIVFWDGSSKGSKNMIDTMKKLNKPVTVHIMEKT